jgi:hypothetical protein
MNTQPKTTPTQAMQIAGVIAGALVAFNVAFYFLSQMYFRDRPVAVDIMSVRGAFGVLTTILAVSTFASVLAPRHVGHVLALIIAALSLIAAIGSFRHGLPNVMGATLLVLGGLVPVLVILSLQHVRGAWAFLIAIMAVFGTIAFFGAPKVRGLLGIGLWTALIVPGLQFVSVIALTMIRGEYREGAPDSRSVLPTQRASAKTP